MSETPQEVRSIEIIRALRAQVEELTRERDGEHDRWLRRGIDAADAIERAERAEARLAKVVEALEAIQAQSGTSEGSATLYAIGLHATAALAATRGGTDE